MCFFGIFIVNKQGLNINYNRKSTVNNNSGHITDIQGIYHSALMPLRPNESHLNMYLLVRGPTSEGNIYKFITNRELECRYYKYIYAYITSSAWFRPDELADNFYSEYLLTMDIIGFKYMTLIYCIVDFTMLFSF